MHFAIWIPFGDAEDQASRDHAGRLVRAGLSTLAADFDVVKKAVPGGSGQGFLYTWRRPGTAPGNPLQLSWQDSLNGLYRIGVGPCLPSELQRNITLPGKTLVLGDNQLWLIPVPERLPLTVLMTAQGLRFEPVHIYQGLAVDREFLLEANRWRQEIINGITEAKFDSLYEFCIRALLVNYRLTPEVINHLQLFHTENITDVFLTIIGGYDLRQKLRDQGVLL